MYDDGGMVIEDGSVTVYAPTTASQPREDGGEIDVWRSADGRSISIPLAWYPRLVRGTPRERNNWRIIGNGEGFHWPDLDEDLSVEGLLLGRPSGESQRSFQRWLDERAKRLEKL